MVVCRGEGSILRPFVGLMTEQLKSCNKIDPSLTERNLNLLAMVRRKRNTFHNDDGRYYDRWPGLYSNLEGFA
jgi:hypothetical protein